MTRRDSMAWLGVALLGLWYWRRQAAAATAAAAVPETLSLSPGDITVEDRSGDAIERLVSQLYQNSDGRRVFLDAQVGGVSVRFNTISDPYLTKNVQGRVVRYIP